MIFYSYVGLPEGNQLMSTLDGGYKFEYQILPIGGVTTLTSSMALEFAVDISSTYFPFYFVNLLHGGMWVIFSVKSH